MERHFGDCDGGWDDVQNGEGSQEINSAQSTLRESGSVTWFCAYNEQRRKKTKAERCRQGLTGLILRGGGWKWEKAARPRLSRPWENYNKTGSLQEAGRNEKKAAHITRLLGSS